MEKILWGKISLEKEQKILKKYKKYKYNGCEKVLETGNTEIFTKDVLGLDKKGYNNGKKKRKNA